MDDHQDLVQLHQSLHQHFNIEELRQLCFELNVEHENLPEQTKDGLARELIRAMKRNGRIPDLAEAIHYHKPAASSEPRIYEHGRYNLANKFTGRQNELAMLDAWLVDKNKPMFAVIALGGTGKSALTWHWLEKVKAMAAPPFKRIIWHGFYETGQVDTFLTDVLEFLGEKPAELGSKRVQLNRLLELLDATPTLLLLDGAERLLRAYSGMNAAYQGDEEQTDVIGHARECVDPVAADLLIGLAQLKNGSKTLMSSRLMPRDLLGRANKLPDTIGRLDLTGLDPEDATRFFAEWGIQATRAEVDAVCAPLDYHPFCMALLAGYAAADFANPNDLRAAADYDPTDDLLGRRQHILQRAYDNLPPTAQLTLSRLAAFRAAVAWETVAAVFGDNNKTRADLHLLEQRGLLQRAQQPATSSQPPAVAFDLHPIARRYAYNRLADRAAVHVQLIVYFEAAPEPQTINSLADLEPTIELYHHLTRAERYDEAAKMYYERLENPFYYQLGAYQQAIELLRALFPGGEDKLPSLSDEAWQAWTLNALANSYSLSGQPGAAVPLFQQQIAIREKLGDKKNTAVGLGNLAYMAQIQIGSLAKAADNLRRRIALCQEIEDRFKEAIGHQEYGRLLTFCGDWRGAKNELRAGKDLHQQSDPGLGGKWWQGTSWLYETIHALLQGRTQDAFLAAEKTLELKLIEFPGVGIVERDVVRSYWLLGWVALAQGNHPESQSRLDEALRRCRAINLVESEPAILLAQARLARATGQTAAAHSYAQQALTIAQRSGYVLDLADIHNHLAHLALEVNDPSTARAHAQKAHDYAFCDGPPYAYQTALDEAERILNSLP